MDLLKIQLKTNPLIRKYFGVLGHFIKQIAILDIGFGFCGFNSYFWIP